MSAVDAIAHVKQENGEWVTHALDEHLGEVGRRAAESAKKFGAEDWGELAGRWHDLGKYSAEFQRYIRSASGYDRSEAHIEGASGRVNHSTAGAIHACEILGAAGRALAYLIAGHHAGLADWHGDQNAAASLSHRLSDRRHLEVLPRNNIPKDILEPVTHPAGKIPGGTDGAHLWLRMLFSCLVDADFLDTEAFMEPVKASLRRDCEDLNALLKRFDIYMSHFDAAECTHVNQVRAEVLRQCRERASDAPGLFSLTVPTGGGKTLSSLAFALTHAVHYGKRRVIYVIPYTSIIEQTAGIFRKIFGDSVIEHHSNLDPDQETAKSRLAAENWDASIIVTTNVQFFESLFAARTSRCRKLHSIVNSVVVLDEAQLLNPEFLQPILDTMNLLVRHYGVTFVLSTATQPALNSREGFGWTFRGLGGVHEIMADPDALYRGLARVTVEMPSDFHARKNWEDIAAKLQTHDSLLAVVNTRADCRELHRLMPKWTIHLSAAMCGEHRAHVIACIRKRLHDKVPTRVISTQLIEAGVDVDFPVVYRALAGLDSIAQAAGRCNREGMLERGKVVVFVPPKSAPPGTLRRAEQTTISLLTGREADPMARELFTRYFEHFYVRAESLDKYGIQDLLTRGARELKVQFRTAASLFRLIDDAESQPILVRYGESHSLIGKLEKDGPKRWLMRKLQRYSVNLPRRAVEKLVITGEVREVWPGIFAQAVDTLYDDEIGVVLGGELSPEQLAI